MTDTFRALCFELVDKIEGKAPFGPDEEDLTNRARAALAQPEPEGPKPEEILAFCARYDGPTPGLPAALRDFFASWARPTPQPVPVSERLPEFSDCDPFEKVWAFNPVLDHWKLTRINRSIHAHWLPANALPTPEATNG